MPSKAPKDYTQAEVDVWLNSIGLGSKVDAFKENGIDGNMLVTLHLHNYSWNISVPKQPRTVINNFPIPYLELNVATVYCCSRNLGKKLHITGKKAMSEITRFEHLVVPIAWIKKLGMECSILPTSMVHTMLDTASDRWSHIDELGHAIHVRRVQIRQGSYMYVCMYV